MKHIPARVPGDTHSALLAAGRIPDPYYGQNELDLQWLGREDWNLVRTFEVDRQTLAESAVFLVCEQLDTIADIFINETSVGHTSNMFVRHVFDVKPQLKAGRNTIRVLFTSAENTAVALAKAMPYRIPFTSNIVQSPDRNMVRKVQCHSGWDWGCCLMVAGITGGIRLEATSTGRIAYITSTQTHGKGRCRVDVGCEFTAVADRADTLEVTLGDKTVEVPVQLRRGTHTYGAMIEIKNPRLWWPNGAGEQHLYPMEVRLGGDCRVRKLGLRQLELISKEDAIGKSFVFRVNGRDLFCKGANWIPADALPQRTTRRRLDDLLTSAAQAHMNMLRVWGGGQYESDDFYELCDEKGLLVWQDFMFSCSLYPATPDFLAGVKTEVVHQVKRLRDFACIALWCGNNEDVGALNWYQESRANRDRYLVDYDRLNEGVIGTTVRECDPTRAWWPSSPCGGENDYSNCWHDPTRGDMHYWAVWHEGKSFDAYLGITPRFCSEFGYQSFPSLDAIRGYCPEGQFNVTSPAMEHHQRNRGGNAKIIEMFSRYFRMPEGFGNFIYLSQVQQALAIKTGVEHWRRLRPTCMGTLYWQLNDNWPVASWASIEYGGKWKLLHYAARRFYAPTVVSTFQTAQGEIEIWLTSDELKEHAGRLTVQCMDFQGKVRKSMVHKIKTRPDGAVLVQKARVADFVAQPEDGFLFLKLEVDGTVFFNEHFFCATKRCELESAGIAIKAGAVPGGFAVTLAADVPAFYVSLQAAGIAGEFDDNMLTLIPGEPRTIVFTPKEKTTVAAFRAALSARHLRQVYT